VDATPFEADSFDRVLSVNTIYFWADPDRGLREIHRVLKPGGRLVLATETRRVPAWAARQGFTYYPQDEQATFVGRNSRALASSADIGFCSRSQRSSDQSRPPVPAGALAGRAHQRRWLVPSPATRDRCCSGGQPARWVQSAPSGKSRTIPGVAEAGAVPGGDRGAAARTSTTRSRRPLQPRRDPARCVAARFDHRGR
jgi:hypothetical protein